MWLKDTILNETSVGKSKEEFQILSQQIDYLGKLSAVVSWFVEKGVSIYFQIFSGTTIANCNYRYSATYERTRTKSYYYQRGKCPHVIN